MKSRKTRAMDASEPDVSIESFLPSPLPPSTRAWLARHRRRQQHLARYAVSTGWSADAARWLSEELVFREAIDRMAVAERRSPDEVRASLAGLSAKRAGRRP